MIVSERGVAAGPDAQPATCAQAGWRRGQRPPREADDPLFLSSSLSLLCPSFHCDLSPLLCLGRILSQNGIFFLGPISYRIISHSGRHLSRFIFDMAPPENSANIEKIIAITLLRATPRRPPQSFDFVHGTNVPCFVQYQVQLY